MTESEFRVLVAETMSLLRGEPSAAAKAVTDVKSAARTLRTPVSRVLVQRMEGHCDLLAGRHTSALNHYRRALRTAERYGLESDWAITASSALQAMVYSDAFDEALALAMRAREAFQKMGDELREARLDVNLANALNRLDRNEEALEHYERALPVLEAHGAVQDIAITRRNLAVCLMALYRLQDAEAMYLSSRTYFSEHGLARLVREVDLNRAHLLGRQGRFREALALYRSVEVPKEEDADFETASAWLDQSEFLVQVHLWSEASSVAAKAATAFEQMSMAFEQGKSHWIRSMALAESKDFDQARQSLKVARRLVRKVPNKLWSELCDLAEAEILSLGGSHRQAAKYFRKVIANLLPLGESQHLAEAALGLARCNMLNGDPTASLQIAETYSQVSTLRETRAEFAAVRAQCSLQLQDRRQARNWIAQALEGLELSREDLGAAVLRQAAALRRGHVHDLAIQLGESVEERFEMVQRGKARTLLELLHERETLYESPESTALRRELAFVQQHVAETRDVTPTGTKRRAVLESRLRTQVHLESVGGVGHPSQLLAKPKTAGEVRASLPNDTACLELWVSGDWIHRFLVTRDEVKEADRVLLAPVLRDSRLLRLHLSRGLRSRRSRAHAAAQRILESLGNNLYDGINLPGSIQSWVVSPHERLHGIPFHALSYRGAPLLDRFEVFTCFSTSTWSVLKSRESYGKGGLSIGTPDHLAPQIELEALEVAAVMEDGLALIGEQASFSNWASQAPEKGTLHIASHGLFREDQPMFSSIRMGKDEVCAFDIARLTLGAEMVVLSGCGTGLAFYSEGDEATGLVQAFLVAGARCVLAGLWDADDASTRQFMGVLYQQRASGQAWFEAYRRSIQAMKQSGTGPEGWAPFTFFGPAS